MRMTEASTPIKMVVCAQCGAPHPNHTDTCPRAQIGTDRTPTTPRA